jgi:hypothetical protein
MNNSLQAIEFISAEDFKVEDLIGKLIEKIRANHPAIKILIVSWITFLDTIPELKLINHLHELLPGLFNMLCDKTRDVHISADKCLRHFLKEIDDQFVTLSNDSNIVINKLIEIIIEHCKSPNENAKIIAFEWLHTFLHKFLQTISNVYNKNFKIQTRYFMKLGKNFPMNMNVGKFSFTDGHVYKSNTISTNTHKILASPRKNVNSSCDISFKIKSNLDIDKNLDDVLTDNQHITRNSLISQHTHSFATKIPFQLFPKILDVILLNVNSQNEQIVTITNNCNSALINMIDFYPNELENMNVKNYEDILKNYFSSKKEVTLEIILNWVGKIFGRFYDQMFNKVDVFIDNFTLILNDCDESVKFLILKIKRYLTRSWISFVRSRNIKKNT